MAEILKAERFDLEGGSRTDTLQWLHNTYLPAVQASSGVGWVGHYEIVKSPSKHCVEGAPEKVETTDPTIATGWENVVLTAALSSDVFFGQNNALEALTEAYAKE